jgi:phosphatidate cytidylyltransferase
VPDRRVLSAAVMVPLIVASVLFLGTDVLAVILGAIVLAAAWEWSALIPLQQYALRVSYLLVMVIVMVLLRVNGSVGTVANGVIWLALLWWLVAMVWVSRPAFGNARPALKAGAGFVTLIPSWLSLLILHDRADGGPQLVLFLLVLVWLADSAAYYAGRRWGRTKLAPVVSPGKTWEGVWAALLAGSLFALVAALLYGEPARTVAAFLLVSLLSVMFSVIGDLLESLMKRHQGLKDSGHLIPGHGGVLDRVDSLTAAAPVFLLGLEWMGL